MYGYTKNLKQAEEEIGLPGSPKIAFSLPLNLANKIGLPGLIATPLKKFAKLNFFTTEGIKSCLPAETAPDVIIIFISDLRFFSICCLKNKLIKILDQK